MSLDIHFHQRLVKRLQEERESKTDNMLSGFLDHLAYKRECGYLEALRNVQAWCDEIDEQIREGK